MENKEETKEVINNGYGLQLSHGETYLYNGIKLEVKYKEGVMTDFCYTDKNGNSKVMPIDYIYTRLIPTKLTNAISATYVFYIGLTNDGFNYYLDYYREMELDTYDCCIDALYDILNGAYTTDFINYLDVQLASNDYADPVYAAGLIDDKYNVINLDESKLENPPNDVVALELLGN